MLNCDGYSHATFLVRYYFVVALLVFEVVHHPLPLGAVAAGAPRCGRGDDSRY